MAQQWSHPLGDQDSFPYHFPRADPHSVPPLHHLALPSMPPLLPDLDGAQEDDAARRVHVQCPALPFLSQVIPTHVMFTYVTHRHTQTSTLQLAWP